MSAATPSRGGPIRTTRWSRSPFPEAYSRKYEASLDHPIAEGYLLASDKAELT